MDIILVKSLTPRITEIGNRRVQNKAFLNLNKVYYTIILQFVAKQTNLDYNK